MIVNDEHWLAVADLFSAAALGGDWPTALSAFADACGAERGELIGIGADKAVPFNWMTRTDPAALDEFLAIGGGDPRRNLRVRVGSKAPILASWHDVACSTEDELRRNFLYADYCRRHEVPYGSQTNLMRDDGMLIGLATLRSERRGAPQAEDRRAFEALAPQARAAVRTQLALEGRGADIVRGALDGLDVAAFVCDGAGLVRTHTRAAEAVLQRGVLRLRGRRLGATGVEEARGLEAAIAAAVGGRLAPGQEPVRTVLVRPADGPAAFEVVDVIALPPRPHAFGFEPRAIVAVRGRQREGRELAGLLGLAFGLTPAEADVAVRLAEGHSREAIAEERRASLETVRSQIKTVFAKLDVRRETELSVRLNRMR
ncbi:helix-turn-helix transcriptional regulator [Phenylobacterium sp.]|uniref:helix-turn-helix transcriptional regulator n=1 Tax=Phenylobacterium sp. TaxID=1871053 RepID=UPI002C583111|nr:helix-turn-helix transcriptional regulator [Phenylobacterium sp.]HVI30912.1 helix-turn-helix transcriptional regulator [Phenylobacterium sp.]